MRRVATRLARSPRLPRGLRAWLASATIERIVGHLPDAFNRCVLIVSHELAAAGAPKALVEVVRACRKRNWAAIVIGPADGPYADILATNGALVIVSPYAITDLSPAIELADMVDVVLCNTIACVELVAQLPAPKVVWYLHETGAIAQFVAHHPQLEQSMRAVADVWTASPLVSASLGALRDDPFVLEAACEPVDAPAMAGTDSGGAQALVLGSLEPRKGQDLLIEAYRIGAFAIALSVSFYGRVLDHEFTTRITAAVAGTPGLEYGGVLTPDAAVAALRDAHMVIVCSRDEPLSLVAVEAMSAERIVVCSTASGIARYLRDGESAYVASSPAPADLAAAIGRALADRANWPAVARAGRHVYDRHFSRDAFEQAVLARFDHLFDQAA